ncbi:HypC/HybG/HupF family hydrogenase formation chaperone [Dendrosporobacter sp. 1207_IL3150]|uniref:HypC/HybG/HupF family hydrogenase formation chaperone n=1 Tax=Dendrosporobacter sp. 1207_IL3150 TaxID=3084054 RepID=UPI002FD8DCAD
MCIGVPLRLIERKDFEGIGEISGVKRKITLMFVPEAKVGDYILVHAGCGMQIIDEEAAMETLELLRIISNEVS